MDSTDIQSNQPASFSPELTPAEQAYFSSRGTKADGLTSPPASTGEGDERPDRSPSPTSSEAPPEAPTAQAAPAEDDDPTIFVDEEGRARSTSTGKYVPHAALHKERERRKAVEVEKTQLADKYARIEERLSILNEVMGHQDGPLAPKQTGQPAAQSPLQEAPIDPTIDVFGAIEQIKRQQQAMLAQQQQAQSQYTNDQTFAAVRDAYVKDAQRVMAAKPDFQDAYAHLIKTGHDEMQFMGITDEAARLQKIGELEFQVAARALHNRTSPAEEIYKLAQSRGYTPKASAQAPAPTQTAVAQIDKIARAQKANVTLTNTGSSSGEPLTAEVLGAMSEHEFAETAAKLGKYKLRQIMGG